MPSWRFFDVIAPSPRIEVALLKTANEVPKTWEEFRSKAQILPLGHCIKRLFLNACWNDTLYLVSCAEKIMQTGSPHAQKEIFKIIKQDLDDSTETYCQFRLVFVHRDSQEIGFVSEIESIAS